MADNFLEPADDTAVPLVDPGGTTSGPSGVRQV